MNSTRIFHLFDVVVAVVVVAFALALDLVLVVAAVVLLVVVVVAVGGVVVAVPVALAFALVDLSLGRKYFFTVVLFLGGSTPPAHPCKSAWRPPRFTGIFHQIQQV